MRQLVSGEAGQSFKGKRSFWLICGALPLLIALVGINMQSPWNDELFTLATATSGGPALTAWWCMQSHALPAYPFISWFFSLAGTSIVGARLLSVLAFVGAILCFSRLVWMHFGQRTALVCGAVMAIHPLLIWHAQDARMYALGLFLECAALLALANVLEKGRWFDFGALALTVALGMLNHMYFSFVVLLLVLWALFSAKHERVWHAITLICVVAGLAFIPSVLMILSETEFAGFERGASVMDLIYTALTFSAGYSVGATRDELHLPDALGAMMPHLPYVIPIMLSFWAVVLFGVYRLFQQDRTWCLRIILGPVLLIVLPFVLAFLSSRVSFNVRYVLVAMPFVALFAAYGICNARPRVRWLLVAGLLVAEGVGLFRHYTEEKYFNEDYRALDQWLEATMRDGDTVFRMPNNLVAFLIDPSDFYLNIPTVKPETVDETLQTEGRKIYIIDRPWAYDPRGKIRDTLRAQAGVELVNFQGFEVFVVQDNDAPVQSE